MPAPQPPEIRTMYLSSPRTLKPEADGITSDRPDLVQAEMRKPK